MTTPGLASSAMAQAERRASRLPIRPLIVKHLVGVTTSMRMAQFRWNRCRECYCWMWSLGSTSPVRCRSRSSAATYHDVQSATTPLPIGLASSGQVKSGDAVGTSQLGRTGAINPASKAAVAAASASDSFVAEDHAAVDGKGSIIVDGAFPSRRYLCTLLSVAAWCRRSLHFQNEANGD